MDCSIKEIKQVILAAPRDTSIMIHGQPGIGKTALTEQVAKEEGAEHDVYLAATMDPTDLGGIPFANEKNKTCVFYPPERLVNLTTAAPEHKRGPVVACFDDITTADDHVFAALFRLFQQREVAGFKIRDNVRLIATGNRAEDKAAAKDMPSALNNRFWHVNLKISFDDWRLWAIENKIQPSIVGYLAAQQQKLNTFDPSTADNAFATPRSWAMASRMQEKIGLDSPLLHPVISGCIGEANSVEYQAFIKNTEHLVKPEEIMKDPKAARVPDAAKIDVIHATVASLSFFVSNHPTIDNILKAFTYAQRLPHADMGMVCVHNIVQGIVVPSKNVDFKAKIIGSPIFVDLIENHGYMISS